MDKREAISRIAAKHLKIKTLETQKSDALDFHQVAVWSIKEALEAAFDAGRAAAEKPVEPTSRT
jgi:hypothetical protein